MRLFPSKKQWGSWTLPSKLTALGAYLGIVSLIFYLISLIDFNLNLKSSKTGFEEKKMIKALIDYIRDDFRSASKKFEDITKGTGMYKEDAYIYCSDSYARINNPTKSHELLADLFSQYDSLSLDELKFLALSKIVMLSNKNNDEESLKVLRQLSEKNLINESKDIEALLLLFNYGLDSLSNHVKKNNYPIQEVDFYRKEQYRYWNIFLPIFKQNALKIEYMISCSILRSLDPITFETENLCEYLPLVNITLNNVLKRKKLQFVLDSTLGRIELKGKPYQKNLLTLSNSIGSAFGLNLLLDSLKIDKEIFWDHCNANDINYQFAINKNNDIFYILRSYAVYNENDSSVLIPGCDLSNDIKFEIIRISPTQNKIEIHPVSKLSVSGFYTQIFPQKDFFIISTLGGSGHFLDLIRLDLNGQFIEVLKDDDNLYHTQNLQVNEDGIIQWDFEVDNICNANVERKVVGTVKLNIRENGQFSKTIIYKNPAVDFIMNLNTTKLKYESYLMDKIRIQKHRITDKKFLAYLTRRENACYEKTQIDDLFNLLPTFISPKTSILLVNYPNIEDSLETEIDDKPKDKSHYIFFVKRVPNDFELISIYEVNENRKIKKHILN